MKEAHFDNMTSYYNRFVVLNLDLSEINFIHMHKTVVNEVISRTAITKSIHMMRLTSIVKRAMALEVEEEEEVETGIEPTQSTSVKSKGTCRREPRKRGKKRKHDEMSQCNVPTVQTSTGPDVVYMPTFREVATQTVTDEEILTQEEEYFQEQEIERAQRVLTVDFIKEEDFDSEYPQSEAGDD